MIIDAHAHFEPRLMSTEDLLKLMDQCQVRKMALVPRLTNPPEPAKPDWMMAIQRFLFSYNCLRPLGIAITKTMYRQKDQWNLGPLRWLMKTKVNKMEIIQNPENSMIRELVDNHPQRFGQWLMLNLADPSAVEQLRREGPRPGVIGIKLHPFWHKFSIAEFAQISKLVETLNLPVNIHLGYDAAGDFKSLLQSFPTTTFIFGHLGVPYYKALWHAIVNRANCYVDISSTYHVDRHLIRNAVSVLGAKKILFASDTPYTSPGSINLLTQWIYELPITEDEKKLILYLNAEKIFGAKWPSP